MYRMLSNQLSENSLQNLNNLTADSVEQFVKITSDINLNRFDDRTFSVDDGNPSFPRKSGPWWFGCGKDKKARLSGVREEHVVVYFKYRGFG